MTTSRGRASRAEPKSRAGARAHGVPPHADRDLHYRGGRLLTDLTFTSFYLGGAGAWKRSDMARIDGAVAGALRDRRLENVMAQYFPRRPTCTFEPSRVLPGTLASRFSTADAVALARRLHASGDLDGFDLRTTIFDFVLPSGIVLTDSSAPGRAWRARGRRRRRGTGESDSLHGLGGYHGSVHAGAATIYYTVAAYSEILPSGAENGIVAFRRPWKNVAAILYHELNEARTDPDVDDVLRGGPARLLGWNSDSGDEAGDLPIREADPLSRVFREVRRADGRGTVPVQLMYSNAVHGPEGPRSAPHPPFRRRPGRRSAGRTRERNDA
jgi:hypothetical protein